MSLKNYTVISVRTQCFDTKYTVMSVGTQCFDTKYTVMSVLTQCFGTKYTVMSVLTQRFDTKWCFRQEECFKCRTHIQLQMLSIHYCFLALIFRQSIHKD
jgi:hypothetical protein